MTYTRSLNSELITGTLLEVGGGYSSDKRSVTATRCLKDYKINLVGQPVSIITFTNVKNSFDVMRDLAAGIAVSAEIYPRITGSVGIKYANYAKEDKYSQTYNFIFQAELGDAVLQIKDYGTSVLNAFGLAAYQVGAAQFRKSCGDQLVVQQKLGAKLYVTLKLIFSNIEDKTTFALALGGKLDLLALTIDLKLQFQAQLENKNINLNLEIAAYQEGGNVMQLASIFNKSGSGDYYALNCDIRDLDDCENIISGIIDYAKGDFKEQIIFDQGQIVGNPSIISSIYMNYTQIGLAGSESVVNETIANLRVKLGVEYFKLTEARGYLHNLLYFSRINEMSGNNANSTSMPNLGYKNFSLDLSTMNLQDSIGEVVSGYWTWSPTQIFIAMRLTLIESLKIIMSKLSILESFDIGILKCYEEPEQCQVYPDDRVVNYTLIDGFKKAYQVISTCDGKNYGRFALPIDEGIYQENTKFEISQDIITYSMATYMINIINVTTKQIRIDMIQNELSRADRVYCATLPPKPDFAAVAVYETDFEGQCAEMICPSGGLGPDLSAHVVFIEAQSPL